MKSKTAFLAALIISGLVLASCGQKNKNSLSTTKRSQHQLSAEIHSKMKAMNMPKTSPIAIRIFKEEHIMEVWKQKTDGQYGLITSYQICKWSGKLGPKFMEGDRQAPEGFYTVYQTQMNPNSNYYLSFNIGFPNAYDAVNGRTGKHLMVHGACSSSGCYSMTDESIANIYAFARDSFIGGQLTFQVQAFPFRMTAANMARYRQDPNYTFWRMLKEGYDIFEATKRPPQVNVCERKYVFNRINTTRRPLSPTGACPARVQNMPLAYNAYQNDYNIAFSQEISKMYHQVPAPSIAGSEEARLVADWTARRARGEQVSSTPPSMSPASQEPQGAPDIALNTSGTLLHQNSLFEKSAINSNLNQQQAALLSHE